GRRGQDRRAEPDEEVRGFGGEHPPTPQSGPAARVHRHEVDRVGDTEQPRPVRGHTAARTVLDQPASAERQVEYHRPALVHRGWASNQSRTTGTADSTETWPSRGRSHSSPVGHALSIARACDTGTIRSSSPCTNQAGTVSASREIPQSEAKATSSSTSPSGPAAPAAPASAPS